jgi:hypothetical protein
LALFAQLLDGERVEWMRIHRFARFGPFSCPVEFLERTGSNFGTPRVVVARIDNSLMPTHDFGMLLVMKVASSGFVRNGIVKVSVRHLCLYVHCVLSVQTVLSSRLCLYCPYYSIYCLVDNKEPCNDIARFLCCSSDLYSLRPLTTFYNS